MRQIRSGLFVTALGLVLLSLIYLIPATSLGAEPGQFGTPKGDEGTRIFKATDHPNWVLSKDQNTKNFPPYETFIHLYWEEVTWR